MHEIFNGDDLLINLPEFRTEETVGDCDKYLVLLCALLSPLGFVRAFGLHLLEFPAMKIKRKTHKFVCKKDGGWGCRGVKVRWIFSFSGVCDK